MFVCFSIWKIYILSSTSSVVFFFLIYVYLRKFGNAVNNKNVKLTLHTHPCLLSYPVLSLHVSFCLLSMSSKKWKLPNSSS